MTTVPNYWYCSFDSPEFNVIAVQNDRGLVVPIQTHCFRQILPFLFQFTSFTIYFFKDRITLGGYK